MNDDRVKLLLPPLEAEIVTEALELYLRARPAPTDRRFEYRYRAAAGVLAALQQTFPEDDDPLPPRRRPALED
jgi:hypothetical protein